jgi:hypothetical protein
MGRRMADEFGAYLDEVFSGWHLEAFGACIRLRFFLIIILKTPSF